MEFLGKWESTLSNLQFKTTPKNNRNQITLIHNTSGHKGLKIESGNYRGTICVNGNNLSLGYYNKMEEATEARRHISQHCHKRI